MTMLIKGMEMPECCDDCWALDEYGDYPRCRITEEQRGYNFRIREQRMEHCPLIKVPTPHGRLIDADTIFEQWYQLNFDRKISDGTLAYWNVLLGKAPTVIEAEERCI